MPGRARARLSLVLIGGLVWIAISPHAGFAHADRSEQIELVSQQIELERDADVLEALHLRRADLHRLHEDWAAARRDVERASALSPASPRVALLLGKLLLDSDRAADALEVLDPLLRAHPEITSAHIARARALIDTGRRDEGVAEYDRVLVATHDPHLYLERVRAVAPGSHPRPPQIDRALRGLDEGIDALGPLVTLQLPAIELELAAGRSEAALARLDTLISQSQRKESELFRRAQILERAGRPSDAARSYREARAAIERLPRSRRATPAVARLEGEIEASLARIASTSESARPGLGRTSARAGRP